MTTPVLHRETITTSRIMEFFTTKELMMQIGAPPAAWPLALTKELNDNALDACDSAGIPPEITITLTDDSVTVADNGPGLPWETLKGSLDYLVRVSDKSSYVSPTRGQLGNALKCIWAAAFVADGTRGRVDVSTGGMVYQIDVSLDRIAQQPRLQITRTEDDSVKTGTAITMFWKRIACSLSVDAHADFYRPIPMDLGVLIKRYALCNPHATFTYLPQESADAHISRATHAAWKKWLPSAPTSPHWYDDAKFQQLLLAYLRLDRARNRSRPVREVVAEFDGLSGTKVRKAVLEMAGIDRRAVLEDLLHGDTFRPGLACKLLSAMQGRARPIKPAALGIIGVDHLRSALSPCLLDPDTFFRYKKCLGVAQEIPYVLEVAFGPCALGEDEEARMREGDQRDRLTLISAINWTPALHDEVFSDIRSWLSHAFVDDQDPCLLFIHLASPGVSFTDRGKGHVIVSEAINGALEESIMAVTAEWRKLKKAADKERRVSQRAIDEEQKRQKAKVISVKEAAWQVMEDAYLKASDGGTLPANARQIMYAARPLVAAIVGKYWKNSSTFTQGLLPDFIQAHQKLCAAWDVVYDARGHFREPHTEEEFGIGTLEVRRYIRRWTHTTHRTIGHLTLPHEIETSGPTNRFRYALFLEKEGFNELLVRSQIETRYDLAIMSSKGQTVTSLRTLVEALSARGVTTLVGHDFDKAGLEILDKFTADTRRYTYQSAPCILDLGLRLAEVQAMHLESEPVTYASGVDPRESLRRCGATAEECALLVQRRDRLTGEWHGERIELNAMTSRQFLAWLEDKLVALGVQKVVPDAATLTTAYRQMALTAMLQKHIDAAVRTLPDSETIMVPDGLVDTIRQEITGTGIPWDAALWRVAMSAGETASWPRQRTQQ